MWIECRLNINSFYSKNVLTRIACRVKEGGYGGSRE